MDWRGRAGGRISSWVVRPLASLWLRRGSLAVFVVWLAVEILPFVQVRFMIGANGGKGGFFGIHGLYLSGALEWPRHNVN